MFEMILSIVIISIPCVFYNQLLFYPSILHSIKAAAMMNTMVKQELYQSASNLMSLNNKMRSSDNVDIVSMFVSASVSLFLFVSFQFSISHSTLKTK